MNALSWEMHGRSVWRCVVAQALDVRVLPIAGSRPYLAHARAPPY